MPHSLNVIINDWCTVIPEDSKALTSRNTAYLNLLGCLGYDDLNLPAADLLSQSDLLEGRWLILSPIHWQATHNDALITGAGAELEWSDAEADYWFKAYTEHLKVDNLKLYAHDKNLWLLAADTLPPIHAKPVVDLINKSLMPELAALDPTMYWQKFFTESQMFFASVPNNTALNGVWIWGQGDLGQKKATSICVDSSFLKIANTVSSNVSGYNPNIALKDFEVLLLNNLQNLSHQHQEELKKIQVNWYWNNSAYTRSNLNWITRLWRKMIHAH